MKSNGVEEEKKEMISSLDINQKLAHTEWIDTVILGDCLPILKRMPSDMVDLIVTSPPYADSRKNTYGGIAPDQYVNWFSPIARELKRILKPEGTLILNIKEKVVNGERHNYVIQLILEMQQQGWLWTEEYIWHKKNCYPGKWPNRFRDAWERCLQFNKQKSFKMYQENVMVPMGDWAKERLKNLSKTDKVRDNSRVDSGFGKNVSNWMGRTMAYPTNVLHLATECNNKNHSAAFPKSLPLWFIKLFSKPTDIILDPFAGSGTTCIAAKELGRSYVGIEIQEKYYISANYNINQVIYNSVSQDNSNDTSAKESNSMNNLVYQQYYLYLVNDVLNIFYNKRLEKIGELKLKDVLKRKNPYLYKAKNIELAGDFVKNIVDAFLFSQEETIFGNLLENFAIHISECKYNGFKSKLKSIDLEFERDNKYYAVGIKSGTNWGNSDQINKMKDNFKEAKKILRAHDNNIEVIAVNGCIYGKEAKPYKQDQDPDKSYYKYAGQDFWNFISEDDNLYQEIIVPIDQEAKKKDENFKKVYAAKINEMTQDFINEFMTSDSQINWVKLIDYVSKRDKTASESSNTQLSLDLKDLPDQDS